MKKSNGDDPRIEAAEILLEAVKRDQEQAKGLEYGLGAQWISISPETKVQMSPSDGVASLLEKLAKELMEAQQMSLNLADCVTEIAGSGHPTLSPDRVEPDPHTVTEKLAYSIDHLRMINSRNREALNRLNATLGR